MGMLKRIRTKLKLRKAMKKADEPWFYVCFELDGSEGEHWLKVPAGSVEEAKRFSTRVLSKRHGDGFKITNVSSV